MIVLSEEQANQFMFTLGHPGVCLSCKMVDEFAGCEPDAENYSCPSCGENSLTGFERALEMGIIEIR